MDPRDTTAGIEPVPVPPRTTGTVATANTRVFVALPWQKHCSPLTAFCVSGLVERRRTVTCMNFGDAFVAHSRNTCAELFLGTDCEWMLSIDDDMLIPFGNARWFNAYAGTNLAPEFAGAHAIDRLLSHNKTVVGGLYFGKHPKGAPMYGEGNSTTAEAAFARTAPKDLIKPTRWVATGCLLIHRRVFEDIEKKFPRLSRAKNNGRGHWYSASEHELLDSIDKARGILARGLTPENAYEAQAELERAATAANRNSALGMGEDVSFCVRARQCGHQPYVDFGLVCGHVGHYVYGPWNTSRR